MKKHIDLIWNYNYWANHRILAQATLLSAAQLNEKAPAMADSVLGTIKHVLAAEWLWRQRTQMKVSPTGFEGGDQLVTLELLNQRWAAEEAAMRAYLAGLSEADLDTVIESQNTARTQTFRLPLWQILVHVVNHGTQHRSEAALYLTNLDRSPGGMDFTLYLAEMGR